MTTTEPTSFAAKPGLYTGVPMVEYQALEAASSHRLSNMRRSPAHCRQAIDAPREETPALLLGSLVNAMLLEPHLVKEEFAVAEQCCATTQKKERCSKGGNVRVGGVWFCSQHAKGDKDRPDDCRVVTLDVFELASACVLSVMAHPAAQTLVTARTDTELSVVWTDEETGLLCKARPDFLDRQAPVVNGDLKTCRDAGRKAFERAIWEYGYHLQAAHYRNGLKANGIDAQDFALICVETEPPHAVAVYQFEDDVMDRGEREVRQLLHRYAKCVKSGKWPGYSDQVELIGVPAWAREDTSEI